MIYNKLIKGLPLCTLIAFSCLINACRQIPATTKTTDQTTVINAKEEIQLEPIAAKISDTELTISQLSTLTDRYIFTDSTDLNSVTKEIIFQQLVFKEAMNQGYGKDSAMLNELETYKNIIFEDFQEDSTLINDLAYEAYQHLQSEVEVAHILFYISAYAEPEELKAKKQQADAILARIRNGESFEALAKEFSDDKNTSTAGGYMGWYTGLQLLYPLETSVYDLKVGAVSDPVQSKYGFHLVKLINKRPSRGRVKVKHLLRVVPDKDLEIQLKQKATIDSVRNLTLKGVPFDSLVHLYSDDFRTRDNGGLLPEFWIGSREEKVVEEAVFKLKVNEVSLPVLSSAGWHLFKLLEKNPIPNWADLRSDIINKVTTDSRGEFIEHEWTEATKTALNFKPNQSVINSVLQLGNQSLLNGTWKQPSSGDFLASFLFSIKGESISVQRFLSYVQTYQSTANLPEKNSPIVAMRYLYNRFESSVLKEYGKKNLSLVNTNFKNALQSYYESLVTKSFLNDNIYSKSLRDSVGLQRYYSRTIQNHQFPERAKVIQVISKDQKVIDIIENLLASAKPYNLNRGITPTLFEKNSTAIEISEKDKLSKLVVLLIRNPQYIVEIGGHSDINEADHISAERIKTITKFLTDNGLQLTRIKENDFGKTQPADRFDWQKNQRITFRFFSNSLADIERILKNQGFDLEIKDAVMSKEEVLKDSNTDWKIGSYSQKLEDGSVKNTLIEEIYPARSKSFREARVSVINGYQSELEEKLYQDLLKKYPVELNQTLLNGIYTKKISINK